MPTFHDQQDVGDGLDHVYYAPVTSEGLEKRLGIKLKPHPDKVSEAAALSSVRSPDLKYSLCLPKEILLSKCQLQLPLLSLLHSSTMMFASVPSNLSTLCCDTPNHTFQL